MTETKNLGVTFRCPPELEGIVPRPMPAVQGLPEWFKAMPQTAMSEVLQSEQRTVKKCPPFLDAMTYGFLIPLITDVRVENGRFSWERDIPRGSHFVSAHSPIDFHDNSQVTGSPFFEDDRVLLKFNGFWTIELPVGYSLLITHPFNRSDLPVETADRFGRCRPLPGQLH